MKLLEKEPAKRYPSGKELAEALGEALELADSSWDSPLDVPPRRGPEDSTRESGRGYASLKGAAPAVGSGLEDTVVRPEQPAQGKSSGQGVNEERRFSPPTPGGPGSKREQPSGGVPSGETRLPSAVKEAGERIEAARASAARAKLRPLVAVGAVAALVVLLLWMMFIGSRRPGDGHSPQSLLTEAERRAADRRMAESDIAVTQSSMLSAAIPQGSAQRDEPAPGAEKQAVRNRDAAEIDSLLAKSYGRPKVSPGTKDDAALPPPGPSWLYRGRRVDGAGRTVAAAGPKRYGVPLGAKLRARLLSNLDSRTISGGPVEAMLMRPYVQGGVVVFPSRTMVYGRASTNTGRFAVELTRLRLPDMTEVPFQGLAIDPGDGKPGLLATGRISGTPANNSNIVAAVARGVASAALGKVQGDDGVDLARGAGQTVLNASGQSTVGGGAAETLLLDKGMDFDVFISEAF
jgi:hypothetical protein